MWPAYSGVSVYAVLEKILQDKELLNCPQIFWSDFWSKWTKNGHILARFSVKIGQIVRQFWKILVNIYTLSRHLPFLCPVSLCDSH